MIVSFGSKNTRRIWEGEQINGLSIVIQELARRKLRMLNSSTNLKDLMIPPSNRLEKLKGNLSEFHSIRINDQWSIVFKWKNENAEEVEIIDYH